jgi:hypothetical protein
MITIKHGRATFTVRPENGQAIHDALARLAKGKGPKLPKTKAANRQHDSSKRFYPVFTPAMSTAEYIRQYTGLNSYLFGGSYPPDDVVTYSHADRPAPMLDPSFPEVAAEHED